MPVGRLISLACVTGLLLVGAAPSYAKSEKAPAQKGTTAATSKAKDKGKGTGGGDSDSGAAAVAAGAVAGAALAGILLSERDRTTILQYFDRHPQPATALPPGIAKNLSRGKPLPPGIAKRGVPNALSRQLRIPSGYELQTVGTDVVLIEIGTRIIADILKDAVRK